MTLNELRKHIEDYNRRLNSIRSKKFEDAISRFIKLGEQVKARELKEEVVNNAKI